MRKTRLAFTLIEVLIVVVILAVLAATVIPQFTDSTTDAKASSVKFNLHTLRSQIQLYRTHHDGDVPSADLNELTIATNVSGGTTGDTPFGPYLMKLPVNSFTNSDLIISVTADPGLSDVTTTDGWIYNTNNGEIWINHKDYYTD
ncbi:MAG: prepilin-type N-terminal cleavage/methylation domain-containing protein [Pirellulales bacterium]